MNMVNKRLSTIQKLICMYTYDRKKTIIATAEEPERTSNKPSIDIWQCTTGPLCRVVARNARVSLQSWSILVVGDHTELYLW